MEHSQNTESKIEQWQTAYLCYAGILCTMLSVLVMKWRRVRTLPPGPASVPIFGSVSFFKEFKRKRHHLLTEMESMYGKVFCVRAGTQLVVFLNGYELIREAFVKKGDVFSDRPNWLPSLQQGLADGKGIVWQDGAQAGKVRKFAHQALREFGVGKTSLEQKILLEVEEISQYLRQAQGDKISLKPVMKKSITNIIHDIVFGERFHYDDAKLSEVVRLIEDFFKEGLFLPKNFLPKILCKLLPKDEKAFQEKQAVVKKLRQYIYSYISHHEEVFDAADIKDFIDIYIKSSKEQKQDGGVESLSKGEIFRSIIDLFLAGSETTGTTLEWCFLFMVKYPTVQQRCYQEIQKVLSQSKSKETRYADRRRMPLVEATVLEVQRLATVVPVGVPHINSREATVGGFTIPEKSMVFGNIHSCHMDPAVWDTPAEFRPERHLDENGQVKRNESLIPFSVGPRMCLGETMAKMEIFLVFTNLLRQFEFLHGCESNLPVSVVARKGEPINRSQGVDVIVKERECNWTLD